MLTHVLCKRQFETVEEFNLHVGTSGAPDFQDTAPQCPKVLQLRGYDAQYRRAQLVAPQPATSAGSERLRVTPRADKKYRTNAERQRAYRDRLRGA